MTTEQEDSNAYKHPIDVRFGNTESVEADSVRSGHVGEQGIPVARPIPLPLVESVNKAHPMLLRSLSRRAAWADVGLLILVVIGVEVISTLSLGMATGWVSLTGHQSIRAYLEAFEETDHDADSVASNAMEEHPRVEELNRAILPAGTALRAFGLLLAIALITHRRKQTWSSLGLTLPDARLDIPLGLIAPCVLGGLIAIINITLLMIIPEAFEQMHENARRLHVLIPDLSPLGYAALMGTVGFYEEVVFRGFLLPRLRRATESWVGAVILSTVLFTLPHAKDQVPLALVHVALLSLGFATLTLWRRSLVPAVLAHFLFNFTAVMFLSSIKDSL